MQSEMCMRHTVICGLSGSTIFFHITSQTAGFPKKLQDIKCVFWLPLQHLSEAFLSLTRNEQDMIKNV